jgi:hypothetical protein
MFNEIRALSQAIIQNGGTIYDVVELFTTKSMREMKKTFKDLRDRQLSLQDQASQQKQQELDQAQQQAQATLAQAANLHEQDMTNQNYQNELDRLNKKEIALIGAESKGALPDVNNDMVPDVLEISKITNEQTKVAKDYSVKMAELQSKRLDSMEKLQIEREKLQVARENMANDLAVARENAKGRSSTKTKK